jgi:hypothetical protein
LPLEPQPAKKYLIGYETKVILKAIISIMKKSKDLDEAIRLVTEIANVEE